MIARQLAKKMVLSVAVSNAANWRSAAKIGNKGSLIHSMLQNNMSGLATDLNALIDLNTQYITSLPADIANSIQKHILKQQMAGVRSETIIKQIRPYTAHMKEFQIRRLARTEVAKADTAITRTRAESANLNWYQWKTSKDARVRISHKKVNNVLVNWHDAPAPELLAGQRSEGHYHAGNTFNCRCVALPIVDLRQISFPATVYYAGKLQTFSLKQFAMLSGMQRIAA